MPARFRLVDYSSSLITYNNMECRMLRRGSGGNTGTMRVAALGSHRGQSANTGHWTAAHRLRSPNDQRNTKPKWRRYNDKNVSLETFAKNPNSDASREWRRQATVVAYTTLLDSSGYKGSGKKSSSNTKNANGSRRKR